MHEARPEQKLHVRGVGALSNNEECHEEFLSRVAQPAHRGPHASMSRGDQYGHRGDQGWLKGSCPIPGQLVAGGHRAYRGVQALLVRR